MTQLEIQKQMCEILTPSRNHPDAERIQNEKAGSAVLTLCLKPRPVDRGEAAAHTPTTNTFSRRQQHRAPSFGAGSCEPKANLPQRGCKKTTSAQAGGFSSGTSRPKHRQAVHGCPLRPRAEQKGRASVS